MKYTVHYSRKIRVADYDMLEVGLSREFDDSVTPVELATRLLGIRLKLGLVKKRGRSIGKVRSRLK